MRRAAKVDANQTEIVDVLRSLGASVEPIHMVGKGVPDILIGFRGVTLLAEIKDGAKVPSKRKLTPDEEKWHQTWRGQVAIVESVDDAVQLLNSLR